VLNRVDDFWGDLIKGIVHQLMRKLFALLVCCVSLSPAVIVAHRGRPCVACLFCDFNVAWDAFFLKHQSSTPVL
jgi:hypothetical protein